MMNGPFFRSYLNQQPSRSARSVPVHQTQVRSSPKVISVPVHFVSSEQPPTTLSMSKPSAAIKIQRLFRGFLVRKSVKKITSIRNEVSEIEGRIDDIEVADLIRRDAKERLRVNETLMSLLFKLDSIRGFDCGVRELRKAVTRKAIAIQEKVDSIANQTLDSPNDDINLDNVCTSTSEQDTKTSGFPDKVVDGDGDGDGDLIKEVADDCNLIKAADGRGIEDGRNTSPANDSSEDGKEDHTASMEVHEDTGGNCKNGSRELTVKLMADNEKIMKLMMQISERNEMQTRMINSLSRRVEQLEKALMTENLRRKKKTRVALKRRDGIDI
ncbi:uncharacterized protein LOC112523482 [Cynara cardunculus var. scolymus]|uniref:uncharacterized protein LOC112523482 n=1 Tax=Cynara cardunculus var. scolymus TaxID=59895 RepID=UPI000D62943C|nr:uncharacterized protein LOC112523482 [Cynara cardunculus var. scolymus]